ncbi:MAG TPA: SpoIIE family protein phosphatase [Anaerolineae bacterium]|nr:SpoIIE family protein phosphatase [Anaerolineae bacterium]
MKDNLLRDSLDRLKEQYAATLTEYLGGAGEVALEHAYELGRKAVADGLGVLDIATVHQEALRATLSGVVSSEDIIRITEAASAFFKECMSPFEMTHRSFQEANTALRQLNENLEQQIVERAEALKTVEVNYKLLFDNMNEAVAIHEVIYDGTGNPLDYVIKDVNPRFEEIIGIKRDLAISKGAAVLYGDDRPPYIDIYAKVAETGKPAKFETYFLPTDKYFSISVFSSRKGRFVTVFSDITERKRAEELSNALNSINTAISSTLNVDEIMSVVVREASDVLGVETTLVAIKENHYWVVRYLYGKAHDLLGGRFTDEEAKAAFLVLKTKKPYAINDVFSEEGVSRRVVKRYNIRSSLVTPLLVKDKIVGVMTFLYHSAARKFTEAQLDFAEKLAASVSIALENARLYEAEHYIADTLQESILLMPKRVEGIEFGYLYRSATETAKVGGDFYDIFELEHGKVGVVVGDVAGKGVQAAVLTSVVKDTIKAHAYDGGTPGSIMAKTNEAIVKSTAKSNFVTLFFGILDTETGELEYCSAGHPPAIIKRATSDVELLSTRSPLIGAFSGMRYEDDKSVLHKDDRLIIYTDGIIEARCNGELYGEERLVNMLQNLKPSPAQEMPQTILAEVLRCASGVLVDDVAILAVSLEGK